ncbi:MAG: hypothetical protein DHS20C17_17730 [Cyclobacteriaceae bacterium]|nr:MAG: hypothetical protein DHS20C17_17730 [Cyclobacteriaceae bacterium]
MTQYTQNGIPAAEQWEDIATEFDDDDEALAEFDDDDDSIEAEFDDDDEMVEYDDDDDSIEAEFDDDDEQAEFDDDDDSAASGGEILPFGLIGKGLRGIRRLVRRPRRRRSFKSFRPRNFLRHQLGRGRFRIPSRSRMSGSLRIGRRRIPFRLPSNLATKTDVKRLAVQVKRDVRLNSVAIKKNAAGIRSAIGLARKANKGVATMDKKYRAVTLRQTKVTNAINKRVVSLRKAHELAQQKAQQQAMFSLFMQPELETIKVKIPDAGLDITAGAENQLEVLDSDFETNFLPLLLGMSGSSKGGGMDPMMMFAMVQAFDK